MLFEHLEHIFRTPGNVRETPSARGLRRSAAPTGQHFEQHVLDVRATCSRVFEQHVPRCSGIIFQIIEQHAPGVRTTFSGCWTINIEYQRYEHILKICIHLYTYIYIYLYIYIYIKIITLFRKTRT